MRLSINSINNSINGEKCFIMSYLLIFLKKLPSKFLLPLVKKLVFLYLGFLFLLLAGVGIIFPLIPGIPFLFCSAYFFAKSSTFLNRQIRKTPYLGQPLAHWQDYGVLPVKAKIFGVFFLVLTFIYPVVFSDWPLWLRLIFGFFFALGFFYLLSRPSKVQKSD
ncbi:MAG: DUF454 family protein [Deltaproteobacteria bacterium]|nr:DUF454 family protein [Deltaproteobacteria bacterium]